MTQAIRTNRLRRRRGSALIYVTAALSVLIGFVSLAVDWARVQLVETELQSTADAAARYAATAIRTSDAKAQSNAIASAAENTADGTAVVLTAEDVVFGNWDTGTLRFTSNGTPRNAVQVTARRTAARGTAVPLSWARLVPGLPSSVDIGAVATAYAAPEIYKGFIGYDSFVGKNNLFGGSYDSGTNTAPNAANAASNGLFGTNGTMDVKNNSRIQGSLYLGPSGRNAGLTVTGSTPVLSAPIPTPAMPSWSPGTNPDSTPQAYSTTTATLPAGTYWFTSLSVSSSLSFAGPATVYVNGNVNLDGKLLAAGNVPANLRVYVLGSGRTFSDSGNNNVEICAQVIAPTTALTVKNNLTFYGFGLFQSIETKNNADFYFDESDGPAGPSSAISLVR